MQFDARKAASQVRTGRSAVARGTTWAMQSGEAFEQRVRKQLQSLDEGAAVTDGVSATFRVPGCVINPHDQRLCASPDGDIQYKGVSRSNVWNMVVVVTSRPVGRTCMVSLLTTGLADDLISP